MPNEIQEFISGCFTCVFTGYFMKYEGVYVMLEAAKTLQDMGLPIKFLFVGSGNEENKGVCLFDRKIQSFEYCVNGEW